MLTSTSKHYVFISGGSGFAPDRILVTDRRPLQTLCCEGSAIHCKASLLHYRRKANAYIQVAQASKDDLVASIGGFAKAQCPQRAPSEHSVGITELCRVAYERERMHHALKSSSLLAGAASRSIRWRRTVYPSFTDQLVKANERAMD